MTHAVPYEIVVPWDDALRGMANRCKVRVGGTVFEVRRTTDGYGRWRHVGLRDGGEVTPMRVRFTTVMRDLGCLRPAGDDVAPPDVRTPG